MAKPTLLLLSLTFLSLSSLSSQLSTDAVINAAEILSNSGYVSMSLTLQLISTSLTTTAAAAATTSSQPPPPRAATIFSPSDAAFATSGQPSLSLLRFHFSPIAFSLETLRSLPYGTKIPTMSQGKSLTVTTPNPYHQLSLNNVTVIGSPIYDDGSLIVFGINSFFDMNFEIPSRNYIPSPNFRCLVSETANETTSSYSSYTFKEASRVLRTREYSVMASCLDLQLLALLQQRPNLTVFAPVDYAFPDLVSNFTSDYSSLFLRHVVPCRMTWADLSNLGEGAMLRTFADGFTLRIARVNNELTVNGVAVAVPDMYSSDWLVVHGLRRVLEEVPETPEQGGKSSYEYGGEKKIAPDRNEF